MKIRNASRAAVVFLMFLGLLIVTGLPAYTYIIPTSSPTATISEILGSTFSLDYQGAHYDCYLLNRKMHFGKIEQQGDSFVFVSGSEEAAATIKTLRRARKMTEAKALQKKKADLELLCKTYQAVATNRSKSFIQLVDAKGRKLAMVEEGQTVYLDKLKKAPVGIAVKYPVKVGSLRITLEDKSTRLFNRSPYSLPSSNLTDEGNHQITVVPYTGASAAGAAGARMTVPFKVAKKSIPVNGVCGTAATAYASSAKTFNGSFCSSGKGPGWLLFPDFGAVRNWSCQGVNGGTTAECSASRAALPVNGKCGSAARDYDASSAAYGGIFCAGGGVDPAAPAFPAAGGSAGWSCLGLHGGNSVTCSASRASAAVKGSCGTAAKSYTSNDLGFSGAFCASGTAPQIAPVYPAQGGSVSWSCSGSNGGSSASCSASRFAATVNGECGTAARSYGSSDTAFSGTICGRGTAAPASPVFPAQGTR